MILRINYVIQYKKEQAIIISSLIPERKRCALKISFKRNEHYNGYESLSPFYNLKF